MAKIDSLEREAQDAMRAELIEKNKAAKELLKNELANAKQAQEALIHDATKLKDAREKTGKEGQGLWQSLLKIADKGKKAGILGYIIVSLIEQELGRTDDIDKRARSTVVAYRGTIGSFLNAMKDVEGWKQARTVRGVDANKSDSDLGYTTIRSVISAQTKGDERLAFESALTAFSKAVRDASHNSAANKETGAPALVAIEYKKLTEFLNQVTEMVPVRANKVLEGDSTRRTQLELEGDEGDAEMTAQAVNQ